VGFILDCSIVMSWCFKDESSNYADNIFEYLRNQMDAWVPALWSLEVSNALWIGERRGRITEANMLFFLDQLSYLPVRVEHHSHAHCFSAILNLSRAHNISSYDAAYLDLAIRKGLPLATLDQKLKTAAQNAKVEVYNV
jgi:predicted nucleic acid-binding protein